MGEIASRPPSATALAQPDPRKALRSLGLNPDDPNAHALVLVCQRYGLDPLLGHVSIYKGKVYVHLAAYLHLANQQPAYQGIETVREWQDDTWCHAEVRVHRADRAFAFQRRGKSAKRKPKKQGEGTYEDHDADAKAYAQACRRALRMAFNVCWPEPDPDDGPSASAPAPPPGPVADVARRVARAREHAPVDAAPALDVDVEADVDEETGEIWDHDEEPSIEESAEESAGPVVRDHFPAGPAAASSSDGDSGFSARALRDAQQHPQQGSGVPDADGEGAAGTPEQQAGQQPDARPGAAARPASGAYGDDDRPAVPTAAQIRTLRTTDAAKQLVTAASPAFQEAVKTCVGLGDEELWREFWATATLASWREVLTAARDGIQAEAEAKTGAP